jgi:hypothetical protein
MPKSPLYKRLSSTLVALRNCEANGNSEWAEKHAERIKKMMNHAPHGGGFDSGTTLDMDVSGERRLVFNTAYHHMSEHGYYTGWTEHTVKVTPSFAGFDLKISGRNRNDIKEFIADSFEIFLDTETDE